VLQTLHTKIKNKYQGELTDSIFLLCDKTHHHHVGQSSEPIKCDIMGGDTTYSIKLNLQHAMFIYLDHGIKHSKTTLSHQTTICRILW
jgi:hypothetical protein